MRKPRLKDKFDLPKLNKALDTIWTDEFKEHLLERQRIKIGKLQDRVAELEGIVECKCDVTAR